MDRSEVVMDVGQRQQESSDLVLMALFARMDTVAMAIAAGVTLGLGLVAATAVLLVSGAPPGVPIGSNLSVLGNILPGYSVTWVGCLAGAAWVGVIGAAAGFIIATVWNFGHFVVLGAIALFYQRPNSIVSGRPGGTGTRSVTRLRADRHLLSVATRLNVGISAIVLGLGLGLLLFLATHISVAVADRPGRYLNLAGVFMPGYSASSRGAWLGLLWGALYGGLLGGAITALYERSLGASLPEFVIWDEASVHRLRPPVLRLSSHAFGFALGTIAGLQLMLATWWLVARGTADESFHAKLLSHYLPGYTVDLQGSLIGAPELFFLVYLFSVFAGEIYNCFAKLRRGGK